MKSLFHATVFHRNVSRGWWLPLGLGLLLCLAAASNALAQAAQPDVLGGARNNENEAAPADATASQEFPMNPPGAIIADKAIELYREGKQLMDAGQYAEAVGKFSQAVRTDEMFVQAAYDMGQCFMKMENYDLAVSAFSNALRFSRGVNPEMFNSLGEAYMELDNYADALVNFTRAVEAKPSNPVFLFNRADAMVEVGLFTRDKQTLSLAKILLDKTIELDPNYADAYSDRGRTQIELEKWDEALADMAKACELDPDNREFIQRLAFAYMRRAAEEIDNPTIPEEKIRAYFEQAITQMVRFLELTPPEEKPEDEPDLADPKNVYLALAAARIAVGDLSEPSPEREQQYQDAITNCEKALELDAQLPGAYFNQGVAYRMLGDYRKAIENFTKTLDLAPDYSEAKLRRGIVWFYRGEPALALDDFEGAAAGNTDSRALFWRGLALADQGKFEDAVLAYSDSLRVNPKNTLAYTNRGLAYLRVGGYQRAIDDFNEVIRHNQDDAKSYYRRGVAYELLGDRDTAIQSYQSALQWDPNLEAAKTNLDRLQSK